MTDQMTDPTAEQPPLPGLLSRAIGVIVSPRATFEKIVATPRAGGAMALVAVISGLAIGTFMTTSVGQNALLENMQKTASEMTPERAATMEKMLPYLGVSSGVFALVIVPIMTVIVSGLLFVVFNVIMGGTSTFKQVVAVVAHSQFVSVVGALFTQPLNYFRGTMTSATNLSVFFPNVDENSLLARLLHGVDLFLIWWVIVLAIGLAVLYRRKTGAIATGLLVTYGLIAVGLAYLAQSRMPS